MYIYVLIIIHSFGRYEPRCEFYYNYKDAKKASSFCSYDEDDYCTTNIKRMYVEPSILRKEVRILDKYSTE